MQPIICSFAGHSKQIYDDSIKEDVKNKCRELICDYGVNEFWVGDYGFFDSLAAEAVRELKKQYSHIRLTLVIPYVTKKINEYREQYYINYDSILLADMPENTPIRYRILKCNQYMIDNSEYLIAYIELPFGGAYKTYEYAKRRKYINIINLGNVD